MRRRKRSTQKKRASVFRASTFQIPIFDPFAQTQLEWNEKVVKITNMSFKTISEKEAMLHVQLKEHNMRLEEYKPNLNIVDKVKEFIENIPSVWKYESHQYNSTQPNLILFN